MNNISFDHLHERLADSARDGESSGLSWLIASGADPRHNGSSALRFAAERGHVECVKLLIPLSDPKANDSEALRKAAFNGHAECVLLLAPVSDPKANHSYALRWAAYNGQSETVRQLIPASDPKDSESCALRWAVRNGHVECAKLLIPVSTIKTSRVVWAVLLCGNAEILSLMLASEPLFLAGLDLSHCLADAISNGYPKLAELLSSMIEQKSLAEHLPLPERLNHPMARRI